MVSLPGAPEAAAVAEVLIALMGADPPALLTRADARAPDDYPALLDRAERAHPQVVLAAGPEDGDWREFCLRQADRTLLLAAGRPGAGIAAEPGAARPAGAQPVSRPSNRPTRSPAWRTKALGSNTWSRSSSGTASDSRSRNGMPSSQARCAFSWTMR